MARPDWTKLHPKNEVSPVPQIQGKAKSGKINEVFYKKFVKAKGFYTTDRCTACGLCEEVCVLRNIRLENGRPVWGENCTHCMACICGCPAEAIEYGKKSIGKPRYMCRADV